MAYATGLVNQEPLLQNEYLAAENGIMRAHLPGLRLSDGERAALAKIGKRLGRKGLQQVALIAKPDTILGWYQTGRCEVRRLETAPVARQTAHQLRDRGSGDSLGTRKLQLGLRSDCGSVGQLGAPSVRSDRGQHFAPPRDRASAGEEQNDHLEEFIRRHMDVLAGTDFFTVEVLTWRGLLTYYVLFFIHLDSRRVSIAGITDHPDACWMRQARRSAEVLSPAGRMSFFTIRPATTGCCRIFVTNRS